MSNSDPTPPSCKEKLDSQQEASEPPAYSQHFADGLRSLWDAQSSGAAGQAIGWPPGFLNLLLAAAICLVYSNSLHGPFLYDDLSDILENASIRHLWPLRDVFVNPGSGFTTRPITNLTFAINYATGGQDPFHYHLTNLGIHICAALSFLGVMRRALALPSLKARFAGGIPTLTIVIVSIWALHPLQTESVSYITQRYESLMGLFTLLTFYCTLRMTESPSPVRWALLASLACALALGSKEVAVSLPLLILLFDRTFLAGSLRGAWRARRVLYLGLLVAWSVFAYIQFGYTGKRTFAGYGLTMPWWRYAINQPSVILHYLRLAAWPNPLNIDYFWPVATNWRQLIPGLLLIGSLAVLTLVGLVRNTKWSFLFVFFFFILAPTSSLMPILDLAVEHRMYLPLAPVVIFVIIICFVAVDKINLTFRNSRLIKIITIFFTAVSIAICSSMTYLRNEDYQNELDLWRDSVAKSPQNPRAHHNYAYCLVESGYIDEGIREFIISIKLAPNNPLFHNNYGVLLGEIGRHQEAIEHLNSAVNYDPNNYKYYVNLGIAHRQNNSLEKAIYYFNAANLVDPQASAPYYLLASAMFSINETSRAHELTLKSISLGPSKAEPRLLLGSILLSYGQYSEARIAFESAMRLDGNSARMASDVGWAFHSRGLDQEALSNLRLAQSLKPDNTRTHWRLAWILASSRDDSVRDGAMALSLAESLLQALPSPSHQILDLHAAALAELGRFPEAKASLQAALAQSKDGTENWVPGIKMRQALFEQGRPYREIPKQLPPPNTSNRHPAES